MENDELKVNTNLGKTHKVTSDELENILKEYNENLIKVNSNVINIYKVLNMQKDIISNQETIIEKLNDKVKDLDKLNDRLNEVDVKLKLAKNIAIVSIVVAVISLVMMFIK